MMSQNLHKGAELMPLTDITRLMMPTECSSNTVPGVGFTRVLLQSVDNCWKLKYLVSNGKGQSLRCNSGNGKDVISPRKIVSNGDLTMGMAS